MNSQDLLELVHALNKWAWKSGWMEAGGLSLTAREVIA